MKLLLFLAALLLVASCPALIWVSPGTNATKHKLCVEKDPLTGEEKVYTCQMEPPKLLLIGKVINSKTGEWLNDRLVLIYLKGEEVGRAISTTDEFSENNLGVQDGLFMISISNTYELTEESFNVHGGLRFAKNDSGDIYTWLELEEGSQVSIPIPIKNVTYTVKSVAGDTSTLPPKLMSTKLTRLTKMNEIIVPVSEDETGESQYILPEEIADIGNIQYNSEPQTAILNEITIPINNCGGSSVIAQDFSQTQTFIYEYREEVTGQAGIEIQLPIPIILPKLMATLQAKYGFEQGQIDTRTVAYHMEAQPRTNQVYFVTWKEVWESGTAQTTINNDVIIVPFKVKTNLIYEIDSQKLNCN